MDINIIMLQSISDLFSKLTIRKTDVVSINAFEKIMSTLTDDEDDIINRMSIISENLQFTTIDENIFHASLATRNEIIIRFILSQTSISRIEPEQLEFFTPLGDTVLEEKNAYQLGLILFELNYTFGNDETSQFFYEIIMDIHHKYKL
jgi:hypothetical protein